MTNAEMTKTLEAMQNLRYEYPHPVIRQLIDILSDNVFREIPCLFSFTVGRQMKDRHDSFKYWCVSACERILIQVESSPDDTELRFRFMNREHPWEGVIGTIHTDKMKDITIATQTDESGSHVRYRFTIIGNRKPRIDYQIIMSCDQQSGFVNRVPAAVGQTE